MKSLKTLLSAAALLLASFVAATAADSDELYRQFQNPDNCYRPFVRWWWNGDKVQKDELIRELHLLKDAGIGGVEINPVGFPGGKDNDIKSLVWLSDEWIQCVKDVFDEAEKIGMTCDLIIGSGWPFGAETLPREERASVMLTYAIPLTGGEHFEMSTYAMCKAIDPGVTKVNPRRTCELITLTMTPDPVNDLSEAVDMSGSIKDGVASFDVPEGKHMLYALIRYDSFASVICGAPGASGSIVDHMNKTAVLNYLNHMTDRMEPVTGPLSNHLRAFFVDSMELEGSNWTGDFAEEFKARRGYDLMPWLPFTMFKVGRLGNVEDFDYGAKKGEKFQDQVNRVRFDFELTKAELLQERYMETYTAWCREKGVKSRGQAYGRGFFQLEPSLEHDIPEGESWTTNYLRHKIGVEMGDEDYRRGRAYTMINKYVSSAAHLSGKRVVSCEEMTNTYMVFRTPLEFLKLGSDMNANAGITHSVWHGFNYSPLEIEFPGWIRYGSYYNERNTWWPYFKYLNDYRARMSSQLQNADMYTDIALLPANYDMWSITGVQTEPFPEKLHNPYTSLVWEAIHKNGGGADYITERVIAGSTVRKGKLCYGPKQYGTIFFVGVDSTSPETLEKMLEFVKTGGRIFCIGDYPSKSLGLKDCEERDARIQAAVEQLKAYKDRFILLPKPEDGRYLEWYTDVMEKYSIPHTVTVTNPDRFLLQSRFVTDDKCDMFLFTNGNLTERRETDVIFPSYVTAGKTAWLYDCNTGKRWKLPVQKGRLHMDIAPADTWLIVFNKQSKGEAYAPAPAKGSRTYEVKNWKASLHQPQEDWVKEAEFQELKDLGATEEWKTFMGDVTYTTTVKLTGRMPQYINLGKVGDICELKINGVDCGTQWFSDRIYKIGGLMHEGENTIEVKVTTIMANYMISRKDKWIRDNSQVPAGLIGPVRLYCD